jgi:hypothetical protein
MMNIMRFSVCTAANQLAVLLRPVAQVQVAGEGARQLLGHLRRLQHVAMRRRTPGRPSGTGFPHPQVDEGQRRVEFVVAGLEDAGHGECFRRGSTPPA